MSQVSVSAAEEGSKIVQCLCEGVEEHDRSNDVYDVARETQGESIISKGRPSWRRVLANSRRGRDLVGWGHEISQKRYVCASAN